MMPAAAALASAALLLVAVAVGGAGDAAPHDTVDSAVASAAAAVVAAAMDIGAVAGDTGMSEVDGVVIVADSSSSPLSFVGDADADLAAALALLDRRPRPVVAAVVPNIDENRLSAPASVAVLPAPLLLLAAAVPLAPAAFFSLVGAAADFAVDILVLITARATHHGYT